MNASQGSKDTIKFWTILTIMLLAVAVTVTLIDLGIKAAILAESNKMKLAMEEWEVRNGQKASGRIDQGDSANDSLFPSVPGIVLDTDNAGLEKRSAANGDQKPTRSRAGNRNIVRPSDTD
jgi:hypothetical protein